MFLPGESHGRRSLVGYSPQGRKELDTTERLNFNFHTSVYKIDNQQGLSLKIFLWCGPFVKSLLNLLQYCFLFFMVLVFWLWGMQELGSPTRNATFTPCVGRRTLNHWTTREVPTGTFFRKWLIPPTFPEHGLCVRAMLKGQVSLCPGNSHTLPPPIILPNVLTCYKVSLSCTWNCINVQFRRTLDPPSPSSDDQLLL